ncbi:hypothetical protein B7494_g7272 [Chlorociboria aeruginascens]|nr:hypothetical protein B7494_g7272 [Chlorociboria aeruginascens]
MRTTLTVSLLRFFLTQTQSSSPPLSQHQIHAPSLEVQQEIPPPSSLPSTSRVLRAILLASPSRPSASRQRSPLVYSTSPPTFASTGLAESSSTTLTRPRSFSDQFNLIALPSSTDLPTRGRALTLLTGNHRRPLSIESPPPPPPLLLLLEIEVSKLDSLDPTTDDGQYRKPRSSLSCDNTILVRVGDLLRNATPA